MKLTFENNINTDAEVVKTDDVFTVTADRGLVKTEGIFNIELWLSDDQYAEMVKRSGLEDKAGITFAEILEGDSYVNAYVNMDRYANIKNVVVEYDYKEYIVPLEAEEEENLKNDILRHVVPLGAWLSLFDFDYQLADDEDYAVQLIDLQGANFGGIEEQRFHNFTEIANRMDAYVNDSLLNGEIAFGEPELQLESVAMAYQYAQDHHSPMEPYYRAILKPECVLM